MTTQQPETEVKKAKQRSPAYPAIDLETAIARARELWTQEKSNTAAIDVILGHWSYAKGSSNGLVVLASLLKYGLLTDEGAGDKRKARLTDIARKIILDDRPSSPERNAAIREAALSPSIHKEFWDIYKGLLPSDENLRYELRANRHFTDSAAASFIKELRSTWTFAKLTESVTMSEEDKDKILQKPQGESMGNRTIVIDTPSLQNVKPERVPLRLIGGTEVVIELPPNMTSEAWDHMLRFLEVMKQGYVTLQKAQYAVPSKPSLSLEARELIANVDKGGLPMSMTSNLERIAKEHSITVKGNTTPDEVISQLRKLM